MLKTGKGGEPAIEPILKSEDDIMAGASLSRSPKQDSLALVEKLKTLVESDVYRGLLDTPISTLVDALPAWIDDKGKLSSQVPENDRKHAEFVLCPPSQAEVPKEVRAAMWNLYVRFFPEKVIT